MPTYRITDPSSGRSFRLTGDSPPSEQEIEGIFSSMRPEPSGWGSALDSALRVGRAGVRGVQGLLDTVRSTTTDPLARASARAQGVGNVSTIDPATGAERGLRADEMGLEAMGFGRRQAEPGGRATSQDYDAAAMDAAKRGAWGEALSAALGRNVGAGYLGDIDAWVRGQGGEDTRGAQAARLAEDVAQRPAGFVAGLATDPMSVASGAAVARILGGGVKAAQAATAADRVLAGLGATVGGAGALEGAGAAAEASRKGDWREAGLSSLDAAMAGGMGLLGLKAARASARPGVDAGPAYELDPNLTADARLAAKVVTPEMLDAKGKAIAEARAKGVEFLDPNRELRAYSAELDPAAVPAPEAAPKPTEAPPPVDPVAEAARASEARHEAALERAALEGRDAMGGLSPEDRAALVAIKATEAPPGAPRLAPKRAEAPPRAPEPDLAPIGKDVRLSPAAQRAAEAEGATGRVSELEAKVERVLSIARRAADPSGRKGSMESRRSARRAGAMLRSLRLDPKEITGKPSDAAAVEAALLKKAPPRAQAALRRSVFAEKPGGDLAPAKALDDPLAAGLRESWQAKVQEATPVRPPVDQAEATRSRAGRFFGRFLQPVEKALERLPGVGKELAGRVRAFDRDTETTAGQWTARAAAAVDSLGANEAERAANFSKYVQPAIEGTLKVDAIPEAFRPAAEAFRALEAEVGDLAVAKGLISNRDLLANHWVRVPKDMALAEFQTKVRERALKDQVPVEEAAARIRGERGSVVIATRAGRKAGAEHQRGRGKAALQEGEYRTDPGVFFEHVNEMARRLAEAEHFGPNGEKVQGLLNRLDPEERGSSMGDRAWAQAVIDRMRGVSQGSGKASDISSAVRSLQSATSLVLSPIQQTTSLAQTAGVAGIRPTVRALRDTLWNPNVTPEGRGMRAAADRVRKSFQKAKLDAAETGALFTNLGGELSDLYGTLAGQAPEGGSLGSRAGRLASKTPWLKGAQFIDQAQRIVAAKTAEHFIPQMVKEAQGGSAKAQRGLAWLNVDWKNWTGSPEQMAGAAKAVADKTQYRVGMSQLPGWASTPLGKAAFQFQSFGYQHARFMGHVLGEAARGNAAPLARWAATAYVLGLGANESRNLIKGVSNEEKPESVAKGLEAALKGRNFSSDDPFYQAVAGLASAGGLGILQTAGEKLGDLDKPLELVLGATGGDVGNVVRTVGAAGAGGVKKLEQAAAEAAGDKPAAAAAQRAAEESFGQAGTNLAKTVAGVLPNIPMLPEAVREAASATKPERPGWVGKARDVLEDQGALPVADESARGAEGRKLQAEAKKESAKARETREESEALLKARTLPTVEERFGKAQKARLREEYKAAIIAAIQAGDRDQVREIVREARKNKVMLTMRYVRTLEGRVAMPDQNEEE